MKKLFIFFVCYTCVSLLQAQTPQRFTHRVFSDISVISGLQYSAPSVADETPQNLYFDFYEPANDVMEDRPLVITVFGGAFVAGSRDWVDMVAIADTLAHYGYTVASIDYRLINSLDVTSEVKVIRGAYMATQDVSAAIRYFKGNAHLFNIDTNRIFLLGNSAGTISALHALYMDDDERPLETYADEGGWFGWGALPDLGTVHSSGFPMYARYSPSIAGLIAQWGGVMDLNIMDADEKTPVCFIHGTDDSTIPYYSGVPYSDGTLGLANLVMPEMYGSYYMAHRLDSLQIENELHPFAGEPHCFYLDGLFTLNPEKLDACLRIAIAFMARYLEPELPSSIVENGGFDIMVYPNPAKDYITLNFLNFPEEGIVRICDMQGKCLKKCSFTEKIDISFLTPGIYLVQITTEKGPVTKKLVKQ